MKVKEKKYGLLKGSLILIAIAVVLTWFIPAGGFSSAGFSETGMTRIGLNDFSWIIYYGLYFSLDKIMMLLVVGGLYGILSKISAYDKLVSSIAKKIGSPKIFAVVTSVIIAGLTSLLTQSYVLLIFIPFIIAIMNRMKIDKMSIMASTFGSMLVGTMGATYGTDGLVYFSTYMATETQTLTSSVLVRLGILVLGIILLNFFIVMRLHKVKKDEETTEMFAIEVEDTKEKTHVKSMLPLIIIGIITFIITILGYVNWNNFGITVFDTFHDALTGITIGDDFAIFSDILGSSLGAFGTWDIFGIIPFVLLFTIIIALCYRVKLDEFVHNFADGLKKMIVPSACVVGAFILMVVVYVSPIVPNIMGKLLDLTDGFNLATMTISSFIANIFHTDLGYTAYTIYSYIPTEFADYESVIWTIFISIYGFVQFFIPTSIVLGVGLTSLDVKYKDWLKYIWRFLVGILVCLLIIFILMAVI